MIPIHLTLQGIYSYQEKQTVDFTKLTEANIFGIFGSVGSGKSTILEAITYALYGRTDRLNLSGDNRNYNMMNLKSNELLIEFIFKTGKDDAEYMATVKSRRNSKQFDDVKALDRTAYKKGNNAWEPIAVDSLETIIGLSYENFKRTIIIPQNRFQEFLQLGNKERTQMMKELFNLDKYELFYKVVSLETRNNQQIQNLEGQLQQLGEINPEQIKEAEKALALVKKEIEAQSLELSSLQEQEGKLKNLKDLTEKIKEQEQNLTLLKAQEPHFILLDKNIKEYEYCRLNFKSLLESAREIAAKIQLIEQNIAKDKVLLGDTSKLLSEVRISFDTIKKDFDGREILKQQAEELVKIAKLNELEKSGIHLNERISNGEKIFNEAVEKIDQLKRLQEGLTASVKVLKEQYPDMAQLSKIKDWFTVNKLLVSAHNDCNAELTSVQTDLQGIDKLKLRLWENDCFANIPQTSSYNKVTAALDDKKQQIRRFIEDVNREMEHLSIQSKLEEYASNLAEGKPCPLCGALSHPQPLNAQNVSEALEKARKQKDTYEKDIAAIDQCQKKLSEIETKLQLKKELLEKTLQKQKEHADKISNHQKLFTWEAYKDESKVIAEFSKAEQLQLQIMEKEGELENATKKWEVENQNKEKYYKAIEDFRHQLTANKTESATLAGQIKIFQIQEFADKTTAEIEKQKESCLRKYKEIETLYEATTNKINTLQKESDTIAGRLEANQKTWVQETDAQKLIDAKIQEQLAQSDYNAIAEVEKVLAQSLDIEKEKKKVAEFRQSLDFSVKQLSAFTTEMGNQKYDGQQHQTILLSVAQLTEEVKRKNQNQGRLESELNKLKSDLETQKELRNLANTLQARADDIKTLKQLFKASGFVNYISSVYLQELCYAANERFYKLTRQKLSLEVTDDNNFQVRDFMNGGKARNVKTLSGGQTFQAALSLALALADNIQKITESNQNFFFLDEGFGSLDKESLDIVFDTLKSLRKENRIVGVISHVEEMQQEIDAHLKIINDEEKGSLIKPSWC